MAEGDERTGGGDFEQGRVPRGEAGSLQSRRDGQAAMRHEGIVAGVPNPLRLRPPVAQVAGVEEAFVPALAVLPEEHLVSYPMIARALARRELNRLRAAQRHRHAQRDLLRGIEGP